MPIPPNGRVPNPYYLGNRLPPEAQRFTHRTHDIFLVTRLDGFTVDDVIKLIDRGAAPQNEGVFVLDQRAVLIGNRVGDEWLSSAAERLAKDGLAARVQLERSTSPAAAANPALGYYSWGSNDASLSSRRVDVTFAPGALAGMFVSTDARTFKEPPAEWNIGKWGQQKGYFEGSPQSLTGDLIRAGVTGVSGSRRRAVSGWKRQTADFVPGVCRGLQSRGVVLSFDPLSVLAEHRHRRSVMCAVQKSERRRRRPCSARRPRDRASAVLLRSAAGSARVVRDSPRSFQADAEGERPSASCRPERRCDRARGRHENRADVERSALRAGDHLRCARRI